MAHTQDPMEVLNRYLDEHGMKHTRQREIIVGEFLKSNKHLQIEELLNQVKKIEPSIGYVTVYRTLMLLKECGLAHQRHFGDGKSLFEKAGDHHDHMICIKCGSINEFEDDRIEKLQEQVAKRINFKIVSHRHEIYGCCSRCQNE
ncbi:MAG: transcriptional repressor [Deltaproteobacteria bacterium]|nr:transcriptional repressor [Deltaproteobacteria bacterium]